MRSINKKIWYSIPIVVAIGFVVLCVFSWLDEILDLPHLIFDAPKTPFNWNEAIIETVTIFIAAILTIWGVLFVMGQYARISEAFFKSRRELAEKNKQLRHLNKLKNSFIGIAAHDLRNPLVTVQLMISLLSEQIEENVKEKQTELIGKIQRSVDFMIDLVNSLLDVAKIEAGKLELNKTENDYVGFVNESIELNRLIAGRKDITISVKAQDVPHKIWFDKYRINQLINNLVGNAVKYSFANTKIIIEISCQKHNVLTKIIDQGPGIPKNELVDIFREYYKADVTGSKKAEATGLGLAIAKKIVEKHKGKIGVDSAPGKGAVFYFTLPM
ncbi:MAG: HAMP domain-containing sensor histidine kinase [Candidatus Omnitrophota bacterium]